MAIKTVKELKEEISLLPSQYKEAVENQTRTYFEVERLKQKIEKLETSLSSENEPEETEPLDEDDSFLLDLETKLEKLKLKLNQTEYNVELNARRTTEKITESTVKALVGTDEKVYSLREQLIDEQANLKTKKSELKRQQQERREKDRTNRWQKKPTPHSKELETLEAKLFTARQEQVSANDKVEFLKVKLETYRLLVGLEGFDEIEE